MEETDARFEHFSAFENVLLHVNVNIVRRCKECVAVRAIPACDVMWALFGIWRPVGCGLHCGAEHALEDLTRRGGLVRDGPNDLRQAVK